MTVWQADCKDVSTVPAEPEGKRPHGVQTLTIPDLGTTVLLDAQVRADFTAEVAREAFVEPLQRYGRPVGVVVDRDVRLSWAVQQAAISQPPRFALLCLPGHPDARLRPASPPRKWVCREVPPNLSTG